MPLQVILPRLLFDQQTQGGLPLDQVLDVGLLDTAAIRVLTTEQAAARLPGWGALPQAATAASGSKDEARQGRSTAEQGGLGHERGHAAGWDSMLPSPVRTVLEGAASTHHDNVAQQDGVHSQQARQSIFGIQQAQHTGQLRQQAQQEGHLKATRNQPRRAQEQAPKQPWYWDHLAAWSLRGLNANVQRLATDLEAFLSTRQETVQPSAGGLNNAGIHSGVADTTGASNNSSSSSLWGVASAVQHAEVLPKGFTCSQHELNQLGSNWHAHLIVALAAFEVRACSMTNTHETCSCYFWCKLCKGAGRVVLLANIQLGCLYNMHKLNSAHFTRHALG